MAGNNGGPDRGEEFRGASLTRTHVPERHNTLAASGRSRDALGALSCDFSVLLVLPLVAFAAGGSV